MAYLGACAKSSTGGCTYVTTNNSDGHGSPPEGDKCRPIPSEIRELSN